LDEAGDQRTVLEKRDDELGAQIMADGGEGRSSFVWFLASLGPDKFFVWPLWKKLLFVLAVIVLGTGSFALYAYVRDWVLHL